MKSKIMRQRLVAVCLSAAVLAGCGSNASSPQSNTNSSNTSAKASFIVTQDMITFDQEDYYTDWKNENPNYIELNGNSASLNGSGAVVDGSKITINAAGVYVLQGKLNNGQVIVDVKDKGTVKLVLNGAEINSSNSSPIYVKDAGKSIISLQEGTQNTITDGQKYVLEETSSDEPNSAVFSKANLTINGTGSLTVRGNYNNGITSKDDLKVTGGNINIYAKDDAILGRDMLVVKETNMKIEAGGDGLKATNDTEANKGFIGLQGGVYDIKAGADGIQAGTSILISGGKYTIATVGGSAAAPQRVEEERGKPMQQPNTDTTTQTAEEETQSAKGLKAPSDISITGGSLTIDSADDSIHSNNSINIAAGDFSITSGDDGIHADSSITVKNGKINISKSYEGIESSVITFDGGQTHIVSSDDGVNAGGGADGSSVDGRPGQNNFASNGNYKLNINGGFLSIDSKGDGLDSNGSIYMTGGTAVVSGPTANNNGALDYNGEFIISGGLLSSAGSSGMAQAPSDTSTQYSIAMSFSATQKAGTVFALKDSKGNTIAAIAPLKDYQTVVVSSPDLKKGGEYTVYAGGTASGSLTNGLYVDGSHKDGTKVVSFTIENIATWLNESGITTPQSGMHGGQRMPGGGKGRPENGMPPAQNP